MTGFYRLLHIYWLGKKTISAKGPSYYCPAEIRVKSLTLAPSSGGNVALVRFGLTSSKLLMLTFLCYAAGLSITSLK